MTVVASGITASVAAWRGREEQWLFSKYFLIAKKDFHCCLLAGSPPFSIPRIATPASAHGEGNGTPLQHSCLENPMDGGAWKAAVHGVAKSRTQLSDFPFTFHFHALEKEMATHSSVLTLENPRDGWAWWAAVYGVAQSRTRLKWLSSSQCPNQYGKQKELAWLKIPFLSLGWELISGCMTTQKVST